MKNKMIRFVHDCHQLYTVEQNKTSLSPFNDKRYIQEDGVSHSFGHYEIELVNVLDDYDMELVNVLNDHDMELVEDLDDLICEANME